MPVDFSRVGLEGIEAGQRTLDQIEGRKVSALLRQEKEMELSLGQKEIDLQEQAGRSLSDISQGKAPLSTKLFGDLDEESASAPLFVMADTFMRAGLPKQGEKYLNSAMDIKKQESDIRGAKITNEGNKLENIVKTANVVSSTIGIAKNESEWRWGLKKLREAEALDVEALDKLEQMEYDPDVVTYINEQALTAYQRATLDMQAGNAKASQIIARENLETSRTRLDFERQRLEISRSAEARQQKNGTSSTAPSSNELTSAEAAVKNYVFKGAVPKSQEGAYKAGAQAIAARAKDLVREDKSLNWDTAVNRAVIESQVNGDWDITEAVDKIGSWFDKEKEVKYGMGKTPETAMPVPMTDAGKLDTGKMKAGKYYITGKGKLKWVGTGFEVEE